MNIFSIIFIFLLGLSSIIYIFLIKKLNYWTYRNIPYVQPEFFYGNVRGIAKAFHPGEFWNKMYSQLKPLGPIGGVYMYIKPMAIVTDLNLISNILIKDFNIFTNRVGYFNEKDDPFSAHIINLENEFWRNMRKNLSPSFTISKLKMRSDVFLNTCDKLVAVIENRTSKSGQIGMVDLLLRFVMDTVGSTEFNIDCNSLGDKNSKFYEIALRDLGSFSFLRRMLLVTFTDLFRKLHVTTTDDVVKDFYTDVLKKSMKYRQENPQIQQEDLMNQLLKQKNSSSPEALTFNQVAAHYYVFSVAGVETGAAAIIFCMFELSVNEDIQKKARDSIVTVLKNHKSLNYEAIREMHYLQQCINEALRKYPPVTNVTRVAKEDYHVADTNIVIEKGMSLICPIHAIHTDPEIYPEPEKYDPDRFSDEEVKKRHPLSFIPFSAGPRGCLASRYANTLLKMALVKILLNFEFKLDRTKTKIPLKMAPEKLVCWPNEDIVIDFKKITNP